MSSLLYPAIQKFYSALNNLDKFSKEKDFFDNISSLDSFFAEFRNITFVLQKSLKHTEYMPIYEKNRIKYLTDCKWFIDKRNETTKEQPFQLTKQIDITIYFPEQSLKVSSMKFTIENDVEISLLIEKFKQTFLEISPIEIFFSAEFSFFEDGSSLDIYYELLKGIIKMNNFLNAMKEEINEVCELCKRVEEKISKFNFWVSPRDMFLVTDYVYYPQKDKFDKATRIAMVMRDEKKAPMRMSVDCFNKGILQNMEVSLFERFVAMHAMQQNIDVMPAIMIVYKDSTFELDVFQADIKTTTYRKINETSIKIANNDIKEVYWMQTYSFITFSPELLNITAVERLAYSKEEFLTFMKVDFELNEEEYIFEGQNLDSMSYIANNFKNGKKKKLHIGKNNMRPIIDAFKQKQGNK